MRHVILLLAVAAACNHPAAPPIAPALAPDPVTVVTAAPAATPRTPEALEALLAAYDRQVAAKADPASLALAAREIDRVAAQRDALVSRLFWYTDLEEAKAEAQKTGRPILSLRLLGRLDDELSCANSRLFRLVLYANEHVSQFLRESYVLHWSSERPAPRMTVDFGDGRVIERTITGNSVHYVLDARGRLVDALPGLYGPAAFERGLRASLDLARKSAGLSEEESAKAVARYHTRATWALTASWKKELARAYGDTYASYLENARLPDPVTSSWHDPLYASLPASVVNTLTMSKADLEAPALTLFQPEIVAHGDLGDWSKVAAGAPPEHLDARSVALIREKRPRDWSSREAGELGEAQLAKRLAAFERRLVEEGLRNEVALHGALHARLSRPSRVAWEPVNEFVYTRLFMTGRSDPWLGLTPTTALTGIENDGIVAGR
jgi:hypothetical protein